MLETIRERAKDNKVIYLFVDNAGYHSKGEVDEAYERLNIVPVFNVGYQYMLNPVERYWSLVKHYYRKVLLEKMLKCPTAREQPMKDAMKEPLKSLKLQRVSLISSRRLSISFEERLMRSGEKEV